MAGNVLILECILENTVSDITEILLYWEKRDQVNKQTIAGHWGKVLQVEKKALWEFRGGGNHTVERWGIGTRREDSQRN